MRLEVVSGFGVGVALERLHVMAAECTQVRQVDNHDTLACTIAWPASLRNRSTVRLTRDDARVFEYRITSLVVDESGAWARIVGAGPWASLAKAGLIREVVDGVPTYAFAAEGTISELCTTYFLPNLAVDGLEWIDSTLGPIDVDAMCTVDFAHWNRAQLIQRLVEQTGYEPYLYQPSAGARYQLAFAVRRGSAATAFVVATDLNLVRHTSEQDDTEILTVVTPFGAVAEGAVERATIADTSWEVSVIDSAWVTLRDPTGLVVPIVFDGQLNGLFLEFATSTTPTRREILASRVSDQSIQLASTTSLNTTALHVRIVADALGTPLVAMVNPGGILAYGSVAGQEDVSGGRGERNFVRNAAFITGVQGWTAGASGWVEAHPVTDTVDLTGMVNGAVSVSDTSIVVDNFLPNAIIRKGELMTGVSAALCAAPSGAGHTIKSDGKATVTLSAGLAYAITDGQTLSMRGTSGVVQSVTVDGNQAAAAMALDLKSFATVTRQLTNGDKIQFEYGGTYKARSTQYINYWNFFGVPTVFGDVIQIAPDGLVDANIVPSTPPLIVGDAVTLTRFSGETFAAVLWRDYDPQSGVLCLDITLPTDALVRVTPTDPFFITVTKTDTVIKTLTSATAQFSEAGLATATWTGGLAQSYGTAAARWMDSANVLVAYLVVSSGAGAGATSAVLSYPTRARILPLAAFDTGSVGADLFFCNATTTLNGSGAGTIPLMFAAPGTLSDNTGLRVYRNTHGWALDVPQYHVMRTVNGTTSDTFVLTIPGSAAHTATCTVVASLFVPISTNFFSSKSPTPNIYPVTLEVRDPVGPVTYTNTVNVAVPASYQTDPRPVPVTFTMTQQVPVTQHRSLTVKLSAADSTHVNALIMLMVHSASVVLTTETGVPFTPTSHGTVLWQRGARRLQLAHMVTSPIAGTIIDLSQISGAQVVPQTVELGQSVYLRVVNDTQRALRITCDPRHVAVLDIGFDRDRPFFEELVA